MRGRACAGAVLLGFALSLPWAGTAAASFGPIQLVSKSAAEQATEALSPAISADGRYLAFRGAIGGLKGVFRKDLTTGAVTPVATGNAYVANAPEPTPAPLRSPPTGATSASTPERGWTRPTTKTKPSTSTSPT